MSESTSEPTPQTPAERIRSERPYPIDLVVGDVHIREQLTKGSLAAVYRGSRHGEDVAVKVYRRDLSAAARWGERIDRERVIQQQVNHPCVARLLDWGRLSDGSPYLVSDWVEGERLEDRLALGPMAWAELFPILFAVGRGLGAIHAAGVVHRDVKPSNVIVPRAGNAAAVIVDFGHSIVLDDDRLTDQGWTLGSASYMAPEQASGQPLDARADLYSLGVVLYRALTGSLPFDGPSAAEVMVRHQRERIVPPSERAPAREIPAAAEDLCLWLLAKDPGARLPSARVLMITLQTMTSGTAAEHGKVA